MKEDIVKYPPVISIIYSLLSLKVQPCLIGKLSNKQLKNDFINRGVLFFEGVNYNVRGSNLSKLYQLLSYKKIVKAILKKEFSNGDLLWIFNLETIILLDDLVAQYPAITHFFEFSPAHFNWKYKIFKPLFNLKSTLKNAKKIVHCEYNRAQITKGLYGLEVLPEILPNKPFIADDILDNIPADISERIADLRDKINNKKAILYQGGFNKQERPLEIFCDAIPSLPDDFIFVLMGPDSTYREELKHKYSGKRYIFTDYFPAPFHLLVTKLSYITILSYYPSCKTFEDVINPIYCAPNKLYEYTKYGKPMIGNNIPGLYYEFQKYTCGICIPDPMTVEAVVEAILKIDGKYDKYSEGALKQYESTDFEKTVKRIIQ